jgi:hypothetical protein
MRFTFVATRPFLSLSRLRFGLTASSRTERFGREPSNSTGGTSTHEDSSFTGARPIPEVGSTVGREIWGAHACVLFSASRRKPRPTGFFATP